MYGQYFDRGLLVRTYLGEKRCRVRTKTDQTARARERERERENESWLAIVKIQKVAE